MNSLTFLVSRKMVARGQHHYWVTLFNYPWMCYARRGKVLYKKNIWWTFFTCTFFIEFLALSSVCQLTSVQTLSNQVLLLSQFLHRKVLFINPLHFKLHCVPTTLLNNCTTVNTCSHRLRFISCAALVSVLIGNRAVKRLRIFDCCSGWVTCFQAVRTKLSHKNYNNHTSQ